MEGMLFELPISIHAPYKEGDGKWKPIFMTVAYISIHAPYKEGDGKQLNEFLSQGVISIHAPYKEGDFFRPRAFSPPTYFNPRPL